jgi:ABC-type nitrate/sulfonate/bicarbonate transport system substrate-binding protein
MAAVTMNKPELSLMMTRYDRTHPLFSGAVTIDGAKLSVCPPPVQGDACYKPVYEQFDIAEMSLSWYVMARLRGEPLIALPIFPLRMFIHPYLFCRASAPIIRPEDLRGKRIGIQQYRITVGLWTRGILKELHGVDYTRNEWLTSEPEGAGFRLPDNIKCASRQEDLESLLLDGALDALILPNVSKRFRAGDARIRRVFADGRAAVDAYFETTGFFPITHTMVVHERLLAKHPWLTEQLVEAFADADRRCRLDYEYPKRFSFPTAVLFLEEEEKRFGNNPWAHGLEPNRKVLEKFVEYAQDQGYISQRPTLDDIFAPITD